MQPALVTDRPQQVADLPIGRVFGGEPCRDDQTPPGPQGASALSEKGLRVGHVRDALDGDDGIEAFRGEWIVRPIAEHVAGPAAPIASPGQVASLCLGDGDTDHGGPDVVGEPTRRAPVPAPDVAHAIARRDPRPLGDQAREVFCRLRRRLVPTQPKAVMEVLTPELAVEAVELVVVMRDGGALGSDVRADHGISAARAPRRPASRWPRRGRRADLLLAFIAHPPSCERRPTPARAYRARFEPPQASSSAAQGRLAASVGSTRATLSPRMEAAGDAASHLLHRIGSLRPTRIPTP